MPKKDESAETETDPKPAADVTIKLSTGEVFKVPRKRTHWKTKAVLTAAKVADGRAQYDDAIAEILGTDQWATLSDLPYAKWLDFLEKWPDAMKEIE